MPTIADMLDTPQPSSPIHDSLAAGIDVLGQLQTVSFTPYIRTVLPVDGFVFWMNANLLSLRRLAEHKITDPAPVLVPGSLHYASRGVQLEDETIVIRRVDFTAEQEITAFAAIAPNVLYVGTWETHLGSFKFTFSARNSFYVQSNIYHYVGDAVYPAFSAQLIDDISAFDQRPVVSNSLPLWLAMMDSVPFVSLIASSVPLYPSFLVPDNLAPPYCAVEIPMSSTRALQSAAYRARDSSRSQLVYERANLIFYGLRNDEVMDFVDYAVDYAANTGNFGIMNSPVPADDHRVQVELTALAQKKRIEFEVNYYQGRCREIARMLIQRAIPSYTISDNPIHPVPPLIVGAEP